MVEQTAIGYKDDDVRCETRCRVRQKSFLKTAWTNYKTKFISILTICHFVVAHDTQIERCRDGALATTAVIQYHNEMTATTTTTGVIGFNIGSFRTAVFSEIN